MQQKKNTTQTVFNEQTQILKEGLEEIKYNTIVELRKLQDDIKSNLIQVIGKGLQRTQSIGKTL